MTGARSTSAVLVEPTVWQLLATRAADAPQATVFQSEAPGGGWQALCWADFTAKVALLRRGLAGAGLVRGDRLALIAPVSLEWELIHHAALSMGVALVGLDAHDLPSRIADMATQAGVSAFAAIDPKVFSGLGPASLAASRLIIMLGAEQAVWPQACRNLSIDGLARLGSSHPEPEAAQAQDVATVIFTSGTTGAPKGMAYTHAQVCLALIAIGDAFSDVGVGGRLLCWLPLSNLFQRMVNLAGLRNGATTYLLGDPRRVMDGIAQVEPDVLVGVPRFFEKLHEGILVRVQALPTAQRLVARWAWNIGRRASQYRQAGTPMPWLLRGLHGLADRLVLRQIRAVMGSRLQCMVTGSAPMPKALLQDFDALGWLVLEAYGLSENVLPMAMNRADAHRFGSVGKPLPGNDIAIGSDGLIRVKGPGVFDGYLGHAPGSALDPQGYYSTGDLGTQDSDGYLFLTGRLGDLIKTSTGRRVAPAGAEASLRSVAGVEQAMLLGNGRRVLVALCACAPGALAAATKPVLTANLASVLGGLNPNERPAALLLLGQPLSIDCGELTPNLKLRRAEIERRYATQIDRLYQQLDTQAAAGQVLMVEVDTAAQSKAEATGIDTK